MEKATRKYLAQAAGKAAQIPFHGCMEGKESNLEPIIRFFFFFTLREADGLWCAAFVYFCCREAGFEIPIRPEACKTCHLAGCIAWEEFAVGDPRIGYHQSSEGFVPEAGDIVLYDRVFENKEHDHIGIVMENRGDTILAAEAQKEKMIQEAAGRSEAIRQVQQANADGIRMIREAGADEAVLTIKSLEAFAQAADGKATKIIIPSEIQGIAGLAASLKEMVKEDGAAGKK